jgi:hypothetical protein
MSESTESNPAVIVDDVALSLSEDEWYAVQDVLRDFGRESDVYQAIELDCRAVSTASDIRIGVPRDIAEAVAGRLETAEADEMTGVGIERETAEQIRSQL